MVLEVEFEKINLKVGLEIHQQLATGAKLFCNCTPIESNEYTKKFFRRLRISKSEMGEYDPAALFEASKAKKFIYYSNPKSSCLVEFDEEPPHDLNAGAKTLALTVATSLNSTIFGEIYPMRKMVIDGSNTSGFQRTMLVSQGGVLEVEGKKIGVQSICLEEDAAKLLHDTDSERTYSLDRLGIPLVEIALEPVSTSPPEIKKIALTLGRLLRATKKVARGLGSIRQDVNVSVSGGQVIEVKGVQQLDQLEKVIKYEAKRQDGLNKISKKLQERELSTISREEDVFDITKMFTESKSKILQKAVKENWVIKAIKIKNFGGMFGFSPYEGIRLGRELGQMVRFFGLGGIFHSDELPSYGITENDLEPLRSLLKISFNDGYIIMAGPVSKIDFAIDSIINRIEDAKKGTPAETRLATPDGQTTFLRPRPGPSRMYPETDIPPIIVKDEELELARKNIPKPWHESLLDIQQKYNINSQLAEQIFDSEYFELFEKICIIEGTSPNFVASLLCSTITNLERKGLRPDLLTWKEIIKSFELLSQGKITKESMEIIYENIMAGKSNSIDEAIKNSGLHSVDEKELKTILNQILLENEEMVKKQGKRSIGPLMGIAMKKLRGRASGEQISNWLTLKIKEKLEQV